jgi:hypothetical protein
MMKKFQKTNPKFQLSGLGEILDFSVFNMMKKFQKTNSKFQVRDFRSKIWNLEF